MTTTGTILQRARQRGERALSEHDSKQILDEYGVPVAREALVRTASEAVTAAAGLGYPVVLKACAAGEAHKTEKGLVAVGLGSETALREAFAALVARAGQDYAGDFLVQEMVRGSREVMIGMVRDAQFGPCVMFGLGGIFTEILRDVVFRVAPLTTDDAMAMLRAIRGHRILDAVRGLPAVDVGALCRSLVAVGQIGLDHPDVAEIDVNPLIVRDDRAVAVDALVVLAAPAAP
jgi:acetyl-CoA synthetase (ADP-forming)